MLALRLPVELEKKLEEIAIQKRRTKSEILRNALELYLNQFEEEKNAYELGVEFFGKHGSGVSDNSVNYKKKLKSRLNAKSSS
ncbi:MAG: ribbon-helix-helix protein, CopG family [Leptospiraceae bacterium]|nr:ribbon-helix-helix protein, CopG family [Leptospiraceae bacterium]